MDTEAHVIRVLIADDHAIVRRGLMALLKDAKGIVVVAEAADGQEAILKTRVVKPDVILMDLAMPGSTGIEAIEEIKYENPHAHIVVLTSYGDDDKFFAAMMAGATGYLIQETTSEEL